MSTNSTPMAAGLTRFKLQTEFHPGAVVHTRIKSDLKAGVRKVVVKTTWKRTHELGSGAFGVVWAEENTATGDLRAVKTVLKRDVKDLRELDAMMHLHDHPELFISFFGWFEDPLSIYIAMEYIRGGDLSGYIKHQGSKASSQAKQIASQLLEGLVVLHARGICHRDLKPQNILIASISPIWVKISDFGISKRAVGTDLRTSCGTPFYKAPEQHGLLPGHLRTKNSYTTAVDLWALGAVMHQVPTTEIPFVSRYDDDDSTDEGDDSTDEDDDSTDDNVDTADIAYHLPELDMGLLCAYCNGSKPFPAESLQKNDIGAEAIDFVKSLMTVNPEDRVSAIAASRSPWLMETDTRTPNPPKVGVPVSSPELLRTEFQLLGVPVSEEDANLLYTTENKGIITQILSYSKNSLWPLIAIRMGYMEVTKVLLQLEDVNTTKFDKQFVAAAAESGQVAVMELLLNRGAWTSRDGDESYPLADAARGGHLDAMAILLSRGAEINPDVTNTSCMTALQAAAHVGALDAMRMLIANGADVDGAPADGHGLTALQAAASGGHVEAIRLLLDVGQGSIDLPATSNGRTPLQAAAEGGHIDAMNLLLSRGHDPHEPAGYSGGQTAVQVAAKGGHLEALKMLYSKGADLNEDACWQHGRTALQAAVENGHLDTIKFLLHNGADVNQRAGYQYGRTALQIAAGIGNVDMIELLLEEEADVNGKPALKDGITAVQAAVVGGHITALKMLLDHGADDIDAPLEGPKMTGSSPLEFAVARNQLEIVQLLLDHDAHVSDRILRNARKNRRISGDRKILAALSRTIERPG